MKKALPLGRFAISGCAWLLLLAAGRQNADAEDAVSVVVPGVAQRIHFDNPPPHLTNASPEADYRFDLTKESFEIFVPTNYSGQEAFGIFAFVDAGNRMTLPAEWRSLMEREKLICLIPQNVGNDQDISRRLGLTLVGILKTTEHYKIDPRRIFTGGFSGGARCSLHLALLHSDVIAGNVSICGADFYEPVPRVLAADTSNYGVWPAPPDRVAAARMKGRFAFITGSRDFRHGNILDVYQGGFVKNGFQVKLIDDPKMGHQLGSPDSLLAGLRFLDGQR